MNKLHVGILRYNDKCDSTDKRDKRRVIKAGGSLG